MNSTNYVVKKVRGKGAVIHADRMRKLPSELRSDNSDSQGDDMHSTSQPKQRRTASDAAMATSTNCTMTTNCTDTDTSTPLSPPMDTCSDHPPDACVSFGLDICDLTVDETERQGTHGSSTATAVSTAAAELEPSHTVTRQPTRVRRRPARFVETALAPAA